MMCKDMAPTPGKPLRGYSTLRKPQPCGALATFDGYCTVHLKARGYSRCPKCGAWCQPGRTELTPTGSRFVVTCDICDSMGGPAPRPALPLVGTAVEEGIIDQDGDHCCEHGVALDVHCCGDGRPGGCHTGFFPPDKCRCYDPPLDSRAIGDEALRRIPPAGSVRPSPACPWCETNEAVACIADASHAEAPRDVWHCATCGRQFQIPF